MSLRGHAAFAAAVLLLAGCAPEDAPRGDAAAPRDRAQSTPQRGETSAPRAPREATSGEPGSSGVLAPPNKEPVPDVVGMRVEDACRVLLRSGYSGGVIDEAAGARPGRVVKQDPKHGYVGGEGQLVRLTVSAPFRDALLESSACVDRRAEQPGATSPSG